MSRFAKVPEELLRHPEATLEHQALYAHVALEVNYSTAVGEIPNGRLLDRTALGYWKVRRLIDDLARWGFLSVTRRDRRPPIYALVNHKSGPEATRAVQSPESGETPAEERGFARAVSEAPESVESRETRAAQSARDDPQHARSMTARHPEPQISESEAAGSARARGFTIPEGIPAAKVEVLGREYGREVAEAALVEVAYRQRRGERVEIPYALARHLARAYRDRPEELAEHRDRRESEPRRELSPVEFARVARAEQLRAEGCSRCAETPGRIVTDRGPGRAVEVSPCECRARLEAIESGTDSETEAAILAELEGRAAEGVA